MNPVLTRCFVSLELPNYIKDISEQIQDEIRKRNLVDAKYTERNNLHLTLKFLGEINESVLKEVSASLKEIKFSSFDVFLGEAGVFSENDIRIIWLSLKGEGLLKLQTAVDDALKEMFVKEERFMAHITIARVKKTLKKKELLEYLNSLELDEKEHEIKKFYLKKSILTKRGPMYEAVEIYPAQNFK